MLRRTFVANSLVAALSAAAVTDAEAKSMTNSNANATPDGRAEPVLRLPRREVGKPPLLIVVAVEDVGVGGPLPTLRASGRLFVHVLMFAGRCRILRRRILRDSAFRQQQ